MPQVRVTMMYGGVEEISACDVFRSISLFVCMYSSSHHAFVLSLCMYACQNHALALTHPNPNPCNPILVSLGRRRNHQYHRLPYSSQARYRLLAPQTSPLFNLHIPIHSRLCASTYLLGSTAIPFLGPIPGILTPSLPTSSGTSICSPV